MNLRETFYGTLILQQSTGSMICVKGLNPGVISKVG